MKVRINILEVCPSTITNRDGEPLKVTMSNALDGGSVIVLSFHGVTTLTTSFLNSSLGEVVENYGFDALKGKISLVDYTPAVGKAVVDYMNNLRNLVHH